MSNKMLFQVLPYLFMMCPFHTLYFETLIFKGQRNEVEIVHEMYTNSSSIRKSASKNPDFFDTPIVGASLCWNHHPSSYINMVLENKKYITSVILLPGSYIHYELPKQC